MKTCTKTWSDIPFAHRAPNHDGHCKLIHGHNWSIDATFVATAEDENGFVMDFGKLRNFKAWIDSAFDHHLVLSQSDPLLKQITDAVESLGLNNITTVPDCSCEGLAKYFFEKLNAMVQEQTSWRVSVKSLTLWEDSRNRATFTN